MEQQLLFSTIHGSRLYGLDHPDSDYDRFEVYGWLKSRGRQTVNAMEDVTRTSFDRFMKYCDRGVPQYLEAIFSEKVIDDHIPYIRSTYHPNMTNVRDVYSRTIKAFWMEGTEGNSLKLRRHALRLRLNLIAMEEAGRFNPTLTTAEAVLITEQALTLTELPPIR